MAKGLWELMEQPNGNGARVWTLQEELLLAHAVMRFGTDDWNAVSEIMEVRAPQWDHFGGVRFSPHVSTSNLVLPSLYGGRRRRCKLLAKNV
jgi:hypothetical protein